MKKNLLTLTISLLFSIILIELSFKFFFPQNLSTPYRINGKYGLSLNKLNDDAVHYSQNRKVIYKFGNYHNRKYDFNSNKEKILVLGDSFTFGWLLNDKDTFVYKLNKKFSNFHFINAGTSGWGTSDFLRYLKDYCELIQPKYILIFINYLDHERTINSKLFYLDDEDNLKPGENEIHKATLLTENFFYKFLVENFHSINFLRKAYTHIFMFSKEDIITINKKDFIEDKETTPIDREIIKDASQITKKNNFDLFEKVYLDIKNESSKCGGNLILFNLGWENFKKNPKLFFLKKNQNFFKKNAINYIDLNDKMKIIQNNKIKYSIKGDGHPNEQANQIIFENIIDNINF